MYEKCVKEVEKKKSANEKITSKTEQIRKNTADTEETARKKGVDVDDELAKSNLMQGTVDDAGTITTIGEGGAIEQYTKKFVDNLDKKVSNALKESGETVNLAKLEKTLETKLESSGITGSVKETAQKRIVKELDALAKEAVDGTITLEKLNNTKKTIYDTLNFDNPKTKKIEKLIAESLRDVIEKNTKSVDVKSINKELTKHYTVRDYLEKLNGAKVEGGKLSKMAESLSGTGLGALAGSPGGVPGMVIGGLIGKQLAPKLRGFLMKRTFGKTIDFKIKNGEALTKAEAIKVGNKLEETGGLKKAIDELGEEVKGKAGLSMVDTSEDLKKAFFRMNKPKKEVDKILDEIGFVSNQEDLGLKLSEYAKKNKIDSIERFVKTTSDELEALYKYAENRGLQKVNKSKSISGSLNPKKGFFNFFKK